MSQASEFAAMAAEQVHNPVSENIDFSWNDADTSEVGALLDDEDGKNHYLSRRNTTAANRTSTRPISGSWNLEVLEEYENKNRSSSWFLDGSANLLPLSRPPSRIGSRAPSRGPSRTPSRPASRQYQHRASAVIGNRDSVALEPYYPEKDTVEIIISGSDASSSKGASPKDPDDSYGLRSRGQKDALVAPASETKLKPEPLVGFFGLVKRFYPTLPSKYLLFIGLICAISEGASMPVWSYFIAQVLALLGSGTVHEVTTKALTVLGITGGRALAIWGGGFCLFRLSGIWQASMRARAFDLVLKQDKSWFDDERHGASAIAHSLFKDIEDIGPFVGYVISGMIVVAVMVVMSVTWAMISGWQLTLVGLALGPVILAVSTFANGRMAVAEKYNKARRDAVAQTFYEVSTQVYAHSSISPMSSVSGAWLWTATSLKTLRWTPPRQSAMPNEQCGSPQLDRVSLLA